MKKNRVTLNLPDDVDQAYEEQAKRLGISKNAVLIQAIDRARSCDDIHARIEALETYVAQLASLMDRTLYAVSADFSVNQRIARRIWGNSYAQAAEAVADDRDRIFQTLRQEAQMKEGKEKG